MMSDVQPPAAEQILSKLSDGYPRIIWEEAGYRVVQESPLGFVPEQQLGDDAMGQAAWRRWEWNSEAGETHAFVGRFLAYMLVQAEQDNANLKTKTG